MKKSMSNIVKSILDKNIHKELNSACIMIGYQPNMPLSVKELKDRKKK